MGLANLKSIVASLIAAGRPADTPVVAVAAGTLPDQRQCATRLDRLADAMEALKFEPPVLLVIGGVTRLAGLLNWRGLVYEDDRDTPHGAGAEHA